jgi:hypothetical protein
MPPSRKVMSKILNRRLESKYSGFQLRVGRDLILPYTSQVARNCNPL